MIKDYYLLFKEVKRTNDVLRNMQYSSDTGWFGGQIFQPCLVFGVLTQAALNFGHIRVFLRSPRFYSCSSSVILCDDQDLPTFFADFLCTPFPWSKTDLKSSNLLTYDNLIAQLVKNLPARQEILVRFLGRKDPRKKG